MTNQNIENYIHLLRCFYFTTDLPVWLFSKSKKVFSLPKEIDTGASILNNNSLMPANNHENISQIFQNELKEIYIIIPLKEDEYYVLVGPLLNEVVETGFVSNLIRKSIIPFHFKSSMTLHYRNLKILSEEKIHYTQLTLESLLNKTSFVDANKDSKLTFDEIIYNEQKRENRNQAFLHSPYNVEQEIAKTISNGDEENAKRILKEINLTPHAKLASTLMRSYKNSMICSCAFMARAAIAGGVNPDDAFTLSDAYINQIEQIDDIQELQSFESIMIEGYTKKVNNTKKERYSSAILNAIYYIDNHLCEDIDIKKVAKEVYLNPSYLSNLFHNETGITLNEWIMKKRIEEAAHLVLNTNESIADIAFFYRFCSQSYFVKCFKKVIGITPGEYRKQTKNIFIK